MDKNDPPLSPPGKSVPAPARGTSGDPRYEPPITPLQMEQLASDQGSIWAGLGASWGVFVLWFVVWVVIVQSRGLGGVGRLIVGFGGLIACNAVLLLTTKNEPVGVCCWAYSACLRSHCCCFLSVAA